MTALPRKLFTLLGALVALSVGSAALAQNQPTNTQQQVLSRISNAIDKDQRNLRFNLTQEYVARTRVPSGMQAFFLGDSNPDLIRHQRVMRMLSGNTSRAESAYRQSLTAEIMAQTQGMSRQQKFDYIQGRAAETFAAKQRTWNNAEAVMLDRLSRAPSDAASQAEVRAYVESNIRMRQMEEEVYQAALRRQTGTDDTERMRQLLSSISRRKTTLRPSDIPDAAEREREMFFRKMQTEMEIAEYRRLARAGTVINAQTGRVETGETRLAMARDAERALALKLDQNALKPSRYDILAWTLSPDEREIRSKSIATEIKSTPEYVALDMLSPDEFGNQGMRFLALSQALRKQQDGVNDWRAGFVKTAGTNVGPIDNMASMLRTGAADYSRIWDNAGEMSLSRVDARIGRYNTHVDQLAGALTEAGQLQLAARKAGVATDLGKLSPETRRILTEAKYLVGPQGQQRLVINEQSRALSGLKDGLNLPGDHPLNAVSGLNMLEMAATTAVPAAASARVARLLEGLQVSKTGIAAAAFGTDLATGMALTGLTDYAKTGKVDPARIAIESTLLQTTLGGAGRVTNGLSREFAEQIAKNPQARSAAEFALRNTLGLGSEAALQSYYQAKLQGSDVSYDMFLANLMNGAMSRSISRSTDNMFGKPMQGFLDMMPQRVQKQTTQAHEVVARAKAVAEGRLRTVFGEDLLGRSGTADGLQLNAAARGEHLAERMDQALSSGDITWGELKMLYGDNPGMKPILQAVVKRRAEYFEGIVGDAQQRAMNELDVEFGWRRDQLDQQFANKPEQLRQERAKLDAEYASERALIETQPRAPGSDNLTSDVDRSIASERVRKYLKQIYREDRSNHRVPATSAQSYDVNEYIDVFPVIDKIQPRAAELAGVDVTEGDFAGLKHAQAVEAQGMATAMLHMNDAQRRQYRQNVLKDASDPDLVRLQLQAANRSLNSADRALEAEMQRIAQDRPALRENPADLAVRARDNLYGQRTEAIRKTANQLKRVEFDIAALKDQNVAETDPRMQKLRATENQLQAKIQRDWGETLREGIETYASFTGLNAIVQDGQIKKIAIRDLIDDRVPVKDEDGKVIGYEDRPYVRVKPGERRTDLPKNAVQKELTDAQVDSFMRDQVMMMTHHVNGMHEGHEDVVSAASALGKYGERAALALKFQGKDLGSPPFDDLNRWSKEMVENRKEPEALKETLRNLSKAKNGDGTEEDGILKFIEMAGAALPQTEGLWDADRMGLKPHDPDTHKASRDPRTLKGTLANRRRMLEDEEEALRRFGPASAAQVNRQKQASLGSELAELEARKARRAKLSGTYLPEDWDLAESLEAKEAELSRRIERETTLRGGDLTGGTPLDKERAAVQKQIRDLKARFAEKGTPDTEVGPSPAERLLDARISAIKEELGVRGEAADRYARLEADGADALAATPALPEGQAGEVQTLPAVAQADGEAANLTLTVRLGEVSTTVAVRAPTR